MASLLFSSPIMATPSQFSPHPKTFKKPSHFSTRAQKKEIPPTGETSQVKFDRRNLLVSLGGLYGATNLVAPNLPPAFATPIEAPDLNKCSRGTDLNTGQPLDMNCCPPSSTTIIDYKLPAVTTLRHRPAAQRATREYWEKYEKALELMKALPKDDPRRFIQQAHVHCAYCNLAYEQNGDPDVKLEIHSSWLFFPWHRWYIYFYERILGKLIDDPSFAIPFWNWDNPDRGMVMPESFLKKDSSLYNERRNQDHLPPRLVDLTYAGKPYTMNDSKIISNNLTEMHVEMVRNVKHLDDFYGHKYVTGTAPDPGAGAVEGGSHTAIHRWTGEISAEGYDMGNFATAAQDPIFYAHHANVDRLWSIWRDLRGSKQKGFTDKEWLAANFVFYDENAQLVRVYVGDALEHEKMGYNYEKVDLPWLNYKPPASKTKSKIATTTTALKLKDTVFPVKLDKVLKVVVDRPKKSRSKKDKENEEELLVIEGIEVDAAKFVRFEVYVNDEDDKPDELKDKAEYAGGYSQLPSTKSTKVKSKIRLGLMELLEELDVDDDDQILVSVVPRAGGEDITIGGIKIVYEAS